MYIVAKVVISDAKVCAKMVEYVKGPSVVTRNELIIHIGNGIKQSLIVESRLCEPGFVLATLMVSRNSTHTTYTVI